MWLLLVLEDKGLLLVEVRVSDRGVRILVHGKIIQELGEVLLLSRVKEVVLLGRHVRAGIRVKQEGIKLEVCKEGMGEWGGG